MLHGRVVWPFGFKGLRRLIWFGLQKNEVTAIKVLHQGEASMRIAVIGSGLGGSGGGGDSRRARLCRWKSFEKNPWLGGKAAQLNEEGFRFDMGPTILIRPSVLATNLCRGRPRA